ncbi:MAG: HAMP domain-containing protein [Proteobacteria bacterium]|nr:HAMP domain-containing protein [Pseudomonadota bacterium]MBU1708697.1 HAMP domain-containing protein [Pseudomonadota bacterium]
MKLTIYQKLMLGFASIIGIMVISSAYILIALESVSDSAKVTLSSNVRSIDLAKQLQIDLFDEEGYLQKYLISKDQAYYDLFFEVSGRFARNIRALRNAQADPAMQSLVNNIGSTHEYFVMEFSSMRQNPGSVGTIQAVDNWLKALGLQHRTLDHLISLNQLTIGDAMARVESTTRRSSHVALFLVIFSFVGATVIALLIARTITRPIAKLIRGTAKITQGRFDPVIVDTGDETELLARAFNEMGERLMKSNELKAEMMQQISHELRTPLQTILTANEILEGQRLGEINSKQQNLLTSIRDSTNMIAAFSDQYLDIAKVEAGMMTYSLKSLDLGDLVREIVHEMKIVAERNEIALNYSVAQNLPKIKVDPDKICIVLRNLLSNAVKYSLAGGAVHVDVASKGFFLEIQVRDQGVGIPAEAFEHVFTKFYRVRNKAHKKVMGTGLGLAMVKAFVEGHGGNVRVESLEGKGSVFTVELPWDPQSASLNQLPAPADGKLVYD